MESYQGSADRETRTHLGRRERHQVQPSSKCRMMIIEVFLKFQMSFKIDSDSVAPSVMIAHQSAQITDLGERQAIRVILQRTL